MTYFNGFLPVHDEPLAVLISFNIIHYTQPNETGRAWNLRSYIGLRLMAADAVATTTTTQSSLSSLFTGFHFLITRTAINAILITQTVPIYSTASHSCDKYPQRDCLY